jgi:septal ring factor EnvC (AmiA/AmiB activator)
VLQHLRLVVAVLAIGAMLVVPGSRAAAETPARKIARLRAEAVKVQATIDRMNDQIQGLVEDYNTNEDALKATLADERRTRQRLEAAGARLEEASARLTTGSARSTSPGRSPAWASSWASTTSTKHSPRPATRPTR